VSLHHKATHQNLTGLTARPPTRSFAMPDSSHYDPNQPRVPAGHSDGGQWTDGASAASTSPSSSREVLHDTTAKQPWKAVANDFRPDGSLSRQTIINRDGSAIRSDFAATDTRAGWDERHTVFMPDGIITVFENSGPKQTIFDGNGRIVSKSAWTARGPEPAPTALPAFFQAPPVPHPAFRVFGAAVALYTWMSSRNSADQTAVIGFRADLYRPGNSADDAAIWARQLTREEVNDACPRRADAQSITNSAADTLHRGAYPTAAQYGTAVHHWIKEQINGPTTVPPRPPRDPDFRAEVSLQKSNDAGYGVEGSKRIDILENPRKGTVCVHDVKTGEATLLAKRAGELASTVQLLYPGTQHIVVTEVKPGR
jgi:hypothetical protein